MLLWRKQEGLTDRNHLLEKVLLGGFDRNLRGVEGALQDPERRLLDRWRHLAVDTNVLSDYCL